jgi:hypothetical protein
MGEEERSSKGRKRLEEWEEVGTGTTMGTHPNNTTHTQHTHLLNRPFFFFSFRACTTS